MKMVFFCIWVLAFDSTQANPEDFEGLTKV